MGLAKSVLADDFLDEKVAGDNQGQVQEPPQSVLDLLCSYWHDDEGRNAPSPCEFMQLHFSAGTCLAVA